MSTKKWQFSEFWLWKLIISFAILKNAHNLLLKVCKGCFMSLLLLKPCCIPIFCWIARSPTASHPVLPAVCCSGNLDLWAFSKQFVHSWTLECVPWEKLSEISRTCLLKFYIWSSESWAIRISCVLSECARSGKLLENPQLSGESFDWWSSQRILGSWTMCWCCTGSISSTACFLMEVLRDLTMIPWRS